MSLIQANHIPGLTRWYNEGGKEELETIPGVVPAEEVVYARSTATPSASSASASITPTMPRTSATPRHGLPRQLLQDGRYPHRPE